MPEKNEGKENYGRVDQKRGNEDQSIKNVQVGNSGGYGAECRELGTLPHGALPRQREGVEGSPAGISPPGAVVAKLARARKRLVRRSWELVRPGKGKNSIL